VIGLVSIYRALWVQMWALMEMSGLDYSHAMRLQITSKHAEPITSSVSFQNSRLHESTWR